VLEGPKKMTHEPTMKEETSTGRPKKISHLSWKASDRTAKK